MAKKEKSKPIKAIVALCEGKTDVAFLRRLLKIDDYQDYKEIVAKIPQPLGLRGNEKKDSYFIKKLKSYDYDSSRLRDRPILPLIMRRNKGQSDSFILLYDMNGMGRVENYKEIISDYKKLLPAHGSKNNDYESSLNKMDVVLAFIYDLDDESKKQKIGYIQNTFSELIDELRFFNENRPIVTAETFKAIGYHFFSKENSEKGCLEDLVLPMMKESKGELFDNAKNFLNSDGGFIRYKGKNTGEKNESKTGSDFNKSLIGAVGQIEHSGLNNADIIKLTSLLNKDKFKKSENCKAVLKFIKELRGKL